MGFHAGSVLKIVQQTPFDSDRIGQHREFPSLWNCFSLASLTRGFLISTDVFSSTDLRFFQISEALVRSARVNRISRMDEPMRPTKSGKLNQTEVQMSIMLVAVTITFLVLTLPQYTRHIIFTFVDFSSTPENIALSRFLYHVSQKLYLTNSCVNFILYSATGEWKNLCLVLWVPVGSLVSGTWVLVLSPQSIFKVMHFLPRRWMFGEKVELMEWTHCHHTYMCISCLNVVKGITLAIRSERFCPKKTAHKWRCHTYFDWSRTMCL